MTRENNDLPRNPLRVWRKGDQLSARHLQESVDAINTLVRGVPISSQINGLRIPNILQQFRLKEVKDDHLVCVSWDGETEGEEINVAKPPLFRKNVYDFATNGGKTRTLPSGKEIKYTRLNVQKRKGEDVTDDEDTEVQVIVPAYIVDDIIYCVKGIRGGTDIAVPEDANQTNSPDEQLFWLDWNDDGRAWAKATDQDDET